MREQSEAATPAAVERGAPGIPAATHSMTDADFLLYCERENRPDLRSGLLVAAIVLLLCTLIGIKAAGSFSAVVLFGLSLILCSPIAVFAASYLTYLPVRFDAIAFIGAAMAALGAVVFASAGVGVMAGAAVCALVCACVLLLFGLPLARGAVLALAAIVGFVLVSAVAGTAAGALTEALSMLGGVSLAAGYAAFRMQSQTFRLYQNKIELDSLINTDRLTSLNNRAAFDSYLDRVWRQSRRYEANLSIVIVDIDYLGEFNERYGQPEGDRCVQRVAGVLSDIGKRPLDFVARFDESSFALILYDPFTTYIRKLVLNVQTAIAELHIPNERSPIGPRLTASIGAVVLGPNTDKSLDAAVEFAEQALAAAKLRGRDRAVICESADLLQKDDAGAAAEPTSGAG